MTLHPSPPTSSADAILSQSDFARIAKIAKAGWGLNLEKAKMPLIQSRLGRRVKALEMNSFSEYCELLEAGQTHETENFVSALTTNVTHFYREQHHFEMLENEILPRLIAKAQSGEKVRIWSAGCSSGQEPFSIAGSISHKTNNIEGLDLKILATDVDTQVLRIAEKGCYQLSETNFPNDSYRERIFGKNTSETLEVKPSLRRMVTFRKLNLMDRWPISGKFDVIMCRNVAIYFDRETQDRLWSRFSALIPPEGQLFIGHSERIANPERFALCPNGVTSYRRQISQN